MYPTFFISDLHLDPHIPYTLTLFKKFMQQELPSAEALYILGDFFEVWVGDDNSDAFTNEVKNTIKQATDQGKPVYFMPGNRDFLVGKQFIKDTGMHLIPDPYRIELYGTSILLMHGDSLCTSDARHQKFRRFSRHPLMQKLFLCLPLFIRKRIAAKLRSTSKNHMQKIDYDGLDVVPETVKEIMQEQQVTQLIHGHTHRPAIHTFKINDQDVKRLVLGAWHEKGNVLIYQSDQKPELKFFL